MSYLASLPFSLMLVLGLVAAPETPPATSPAPTAVAATPNTPTPAGVDVSSRLTRQVEALPVTLDREGLVEGFDGVSRSVDQCVSRQLKIEGEFDAQQVEVNVTVGRDGKVSRLRLPKPVRQSIFGACMQAHSSRWRFPPFTGKPVKVSKRFIVR